ncbi:alpha-tubulin N-acetyltransferase 1-like [Watersipora subatra]|uniref:alpha-tubulin N-acetyltransferase 1-like n=1 Tax=Watersipora subatra TaxID=2589382 RepID=UPI00355C1653
MNFNFSVNQIVGNRQLFVIDKNLRPANETGSLESARRHLSEVIDRLGEASAKAQRLPGPITTSRKLAYTDQRVYLYTDVENNCAVGFIKVGTKKLFLYDHHGNQKETDPLCILDFYVHESMQRKGYGKQLYEFMTENENVSPAHLAIDKPSDKFIAFLSKHYKLRATIPQVNNYVIFDGFFTGRNDKTSQRTRRGNNSSPSNNPMNVNMTKSSVETRSAGDIAVKHYQATSSSSTSLSSAEELAAFSDIPLARPSSREKLSNCRNSPVTNVAGSASRSDQQLPAAYQTQPFATELSEEVTQLAITNGACSQSAQNKAYSRHTSLSSAALPIRHDYKEPVRTRYGQPNVVSTLDKLNTHQQVQNKQGHLKVTPSKLSQNRQQEAGDWSKTFHQGGRTTTQPTSSWNIFGVPSGYSHIANRRPS